MIENKEWSVLIIILMTVIIQQQLSKWIHIVNDRWAFLDVQDTLIIQRQKRWWRTEEHMQTISDMIEKDFRSSAVGSRNWILDELVWNDPYSVETKMLYSCIH